VGAIVLGVLVMAGASRTTTTFDPATFQPVQDDGMDAIAIVLGLVIMAQGLIGWAALTAFAENVEAVRSMDRHLATMATGQAADSSGSAT